jgi:hypothetical protein
MKFQFIRDHREDFPVRLMCRVLEASPSGFYDWLRRPESPRAVENRALVAKIQAFHRECRGSGACTREGGWQPAGACQPPGRGLPDRPQPGGPADARQRHPGQDQTQSSGSPPTAATTIRSHPIGSTGSSKSQRRTPSGSPISAISRPGKAGCIWPWCSISSPARWWGGQWTRRCPRN